MKRLSLPKGVVLTYKLLKDLYINDKKSVAQIARVLKCSENKINYWLAKNGIKKRSISDAMYEFKNPLGDPFLFKKPKNIDESFLFGLGLGLYWGEGAKRGSGGLRLTNTDPKLLKKFIDFLGNVFNVDRNRLRFSIQIFDDVSERKAKEYWQKELNVNKEQFYKVIVSKVRGVGTYKYKSEYGVVIIYLNNVKLKRLLCEMIENI